MKICLNLTGTELALLYIATGNVNAGRILKEAYAQERALLIASGIEPPKRRQRKKGKNEDR